MELDLYKLSAEEKMEKAISQFQKNIAKISTGRANPQILDSIKIMYFETLTPISQVASITIPEASQLLIKPYDPTLNKTIVGVINSSNLGFNAQDEGDKARITFPPMTLERRKQLVKSLSQYTEQAKVQIRMARQEINKEIKSEHDLSQDEEKHYHDEIQKITDIFVQKVSDLTIEKEKDLMTI